MTMAAQTIIDDAEKRFFDETNLRIGATTWLLYLNNAQRNLVLINKRVYTKNVSVQLTPGVKQAIPASDGIMLLDVVRNTGSAGTSSGQAITFTPMSSLTSNDPGWMTATADATVLHWTKHVDDDLRYYVYPPQPATGSYVELLYSAAPPDVTDPNNNIPLRDVFREPLVLDMLRQAFMSETERQDLEKSKLYGSQVIALVGGG